MQSPMCCGCSSYSTLLRLAVPARQWPLPRFCRSTLAPSHESPPGVLQKDVGPREDALNGAVRVMILCPKRSAEEC